MIEAITVVGLAVVGLLIWGILSLRRTIHQLQDAVQVMATANPSHRAHATPPLRRLAQHINQLADQYERQHALSKEQIAAARADVEEEKQLLTSLIAQIGDSVIVTNRKGQILLYNDVARQMFPAPALLGLNRSIYDLLDADMLHHAADEIAHQHDSGRTDPLIQVIALTTQQQLVRVRIASVVSESGSLDGFIFTLIDVTEQNQTQARRNALLEQLTQSVRASLANLRAASETLAAFPEMGRADSAELNRIILEESQHLSQQLDQLSAELDQTASVQQEVIIGGDLLKAIARRRQPHPTLLTGVETLWLRVDSFSVIRAVLKTVTAIGGETVYLYLHPYRRWAALDIRIEGMEMDALKQQITPLTQVANLHGSVVWCQNAQYRLLLPTAQTPLQAASPKLTSRPEFYDFNLFKPIETNLLQRPLNELTLTVLDCETTGLNPSGGDEIVSLAGIRIVNGRLLEGEQFNMLVNPHRPIPSTATAIHGISDTDVQDAPSIGEVLGLFWEFSADTVLVGHNVAFDMRLFQLKEATTGIHFTQPVLDTLLLAAALYPNRTDYSLESLAELLGVAVDGRHTALGDVRVTGNLFLKMLPLLEANGLTTLSAALDAAQKTYLARLSY